MLDGATARPVADGADEGDDPPLPGSLHAPRHGRRIERGILDRAAAGAARDRRQEGDLVPLLQPLGLARELVVHRHAQAIAVAGEDGVVPGQERAQIRDRGALRQRDLQLLDPRLLAHGAEELHGDAHAGRLPRAGPALNEGTPPRLHDSPRLRQTSGRGGAVRGGARGGGGRPGPASAPP